MTEHGRNSRKCLSLSLMREEVCGRVFLFAHLQVHPKQSPGSIVVFSIEYDSPFPAWSEKNNIVAQTM